METRQDVQVAQIENELKRLQSAASAVTKASLFNLIIYTHEPRRTTYFQDIVRLIMSQFPCRVIFIQGNPQSSTSQLRVQISVEVNPQQPGLACDQIFIEAAGKDLARAPFIVLPILIPDLPVYLLWGQDPSRENAILPHLQTFATRLIFDSEASENLQNFAQDLLKRMQSTHLEISDMNWARIEGWREVLAQIFNTPEKIQQLTSAKSIKIVYNNRPSDLFLHPETQAIYLQAWLAAQLKWKFEKLERVNHDLLVSYRTEYGTLQVTLQGQRKSEIPPEEILEFEASDPAQFLYSLVRTREQVTIHCHTMDLCELPFNLYLTNMWSGKVFMQEVFYHKTSEQYMYMLELIASIPWN